MPWPCFMAEPDNPIDKGRTGAVWYGDLADEWSFALSAEFERDWRGKRDRLLVVRLPDGTPWCVDFAASTSLKAGHKSGWTVSGAPPLLTATPSINILGRYHGFVTDGVVSDDCEGRTFAPGAAES